ncbi:hypothetical protein ACFV5K_26715, partial [Streptomyces sp. NPDC059744]
MAASQPPAGVAAEAPAQGLADVGGSNTGSDPSTGIVGHSHADNRDGDHDGGGGWPGGGGGGHDGG